MARAGGEYKIIYARDFHHWWRYIHNAWAKRLIILTNKINSAVEYFTALCIVKIVISSQGQILTPDVSVSMWRSSSVVIRPSLSMDGQSTKCHQTRKIQRFSKTFEDSRIHRRDLYHVLFINQQDLFKYSVTFNGK